MEGTLFDAAFIGRVTVDGPRVAEPIRRLGQTSVSHHVVVAGVVVVEAAQAIHSVHQLGTHLNNSSNNNSNNNKKPVLIHTRHLGTSDILLEF